MSITYILNLLVSNIKNVKGIDAIVLGGSRATNTATDTSDIDIGIYYNSDFDLEMFRAVASKIDDLHRTDCITNLGDWGPWINGGGWLTVDGIAVDVLFRSTHIVEKSMVDCMTGKITIDYQCGHPFGFINSIYIAELYHCKVLYAETKAIEAMKQQLQYYPQDYKKAAIAKFMWECEFSLLCGKKAIAKNDLLYMAGSIYRCVNCLIQVLFCVNELYCLNEKGSLDRLLKESKIALPNKLEKAIEHIFALCSADLANAFDETSALYQQVFDIVQNCN